MMPVYHGRFLFPGGVWGGLGMCGGMCGGWLGGWAAWGGVLMASAGVHQLKQHEGTDRQQAAQQQRRAGWLCSHQRPQRSLWAVK